MRAGHGPRYGERAPHVTRNIYSSSNEGHTKPPGYIADHPWATVGPSSGAVRHTLETWLLFADADGFVRSSTATIARALCFPNHLRQTHNQTLHMTGHIRPVCGGYLVSRDSMFYGSTGSGE